MSDVYQCPRCALRFPNQSELERHRTLDHPIEQEAETADDGDGGGGVEE